MEELSGIEELARLRHNYELAELRCALPLELIAMLRAEWDSPRSGSLVSQLAELELTVDDQRALSEFASNLLRQAPQLPYRARARADRIVGRLAPLMPGREALEIAKAFLSDHRKSRQAIAHDIMQAVGLDKELASEAIANYQETGDEEYLHILARSPRAVVEIDYRYILERISEGYWRMRVIQSLLGAGRKAAEEVATEYPFEFVYAVGRLKRRDCLPTIRKLLRSNQSDLRFLSMCIWTLAQLRARKEFRMIRPMVQHWLEMAALSDTSPPS